MSARPSPAIVWFRQDLRLGDNPALTAAAASGRPVLALFVLDDAAAGAWKPGGASRWWLHHSLAALAASLRRLGIPLTLKRGSAAAELPRFAAETGAGAVYWSRCYEPFAIRRDTAIKAALVEAGLTVESFSASLVAEPWTLKTQGGGPFKVFTPFWRVLRERPPERPHPVPTPASTVAGPEGERLEDWRLLPTRPDWAGGLRDSWTPGEDGAQAALKRFIDDALDAYARDRDRPGTTGVSRLSPHLHWGEISVRQVWHAVEAKSGPDGEPYLRELGWRDFAYHLLWQFPDLPEQPFTTRFADFPWRDDKTALRAWQRGMTGYPLVDAGMRELWQTGWMHNRARLVVGSFLVKHLLLPWQAGEAWFWDTLVDADLAANAMNWQWVTGSGADAAPYFRIFNPVLQGEKFDPDGRYVRRFVPEIARLPDKWLHKPWMAPDAVLSQAGVTLGRTYPRPIVEHDSARKRALAAFAAISG
jgi:deoxyribodipyrimidine photo-lyase